jgi:hypothetical protein
MRGVGNVSSYQWLWGVVLAASCASQPARVTPAKPTAPVTLQVETVERGDQRFEVRASAIPTQNVDSVLLQLRLPEGAVLEQGEALTSFGPTPVGVARSLSWRVKLSVPGADIVAEARIVNGVQARSRAHVVRLGAALPPEKQPAKTEITLPNGVRVEEVRQ